MRNEKLKMRGITIFLLGTLAVFSVNAQTSVDSVLANIERNNTMLQALRKKTDADKIANKTGNLPANPEVEFNYLWGNPSVIGNRTDFTIKQSFDFPTAYSYRSQISDLKNGQAELEYQKQRRDILQQARLLCADISYQNAMKAEYTGRLDIARQIADVFKKKLDAGETNILDFNKAQVYWLSLSKELEKVEIERNALLAELARLNGGNALELDERVYAAQPLSADFEQWYAQTEPNNPVLQWLSRELAITQKQKQLQVAKNLPKFYAGYMSEKVVGQQYQGVTLGVTIPLWENRNTVKYAGAKTMEVEGFQADSKTQFYNEMKTLHAKALALQNSTHSFREGLSQFSNNGLLARALDKGEISLGEYLTGLSLYYDSIDKLLEMEHAMNIARAELVKYQ